MTAEGSPGLAWRTSSHSGANGDCVQIARRPSGVIAVRDSKDPAGTGLAFIPCQWTAFTAALKGLPAIRSGMAEELAR